MPSLLERFYAKVDKTGPDECWLWRGCQWAGGYGVMTVNQKHVGAHRVSYLLHHGTIPHGMDCCHRCDTPGCVNPAHLFIGTRGDNLKDAFRKGRKSNTGEKNPHNKLTEKQVRYIRETVAKGKHTMAALARKFGVDHECVRMIVHRIKWKHI